jgi:hypothetical protein
MRRRLFSSATALVLVAAMAQSAVAAVQRVRDKPVREYGFAIDRNSAGDTFRAWGADSPRRPYLFSVYWQGTGGPVRRTGPATPAYVGGLDVDNSRGDLLSYEVYNGRTGNWDVRLYDIAAGRSEAIPAGVNTTKQETHPTVSGDYVLFERGTMQGPKQVILVNLTTGVRTQLAVAPANGLVLGDEVNGDYAVYTFCPATQHCRVRRYQISSGITIDLPNARRAAYSSSVTSTGDVYYAIGHPSRCGVNTQIHRWTGGATAPRIQQLSDGIDVASTWAYERLGGGVGVYFTRLVCKPNGFQSGIYVTEG